MADLSSYTPVFVRSAGNDSTGNGTSGAPYATAQAAFAATYAALDGTTNYVLDFDAGSFGGVNLGTTAAVEWPAAIAVRGLGVLNSFLGGITAFGSNSASPTAGKSVTIVSDGTINLGTINATGGKDTTLNGVAGQSGGVISLTDSVADLIITNGGDGSEGYGASGAGGFGGGVSLTNSVTGNISSFGGAGVEFGGSGGGLVLVNSIVGTIDNYGTQGGTQGGHGGNATITNSRCGNIDSRGGRVTQGRDGVAGATGVVTFSGYSILPDTIYATVRTTNLKQGKGVNGSAILGIV